MDTTDTLVQKPASSSFEDTRVGLVPADELVSLCAADTQLYCHTFFPKAFRQRSPAFHREIDELLEDRSHRHVAVAVFRDGGKTTKLRAYISKRIAYGISRTILLVSASQGHSAKSLKWLRKAVEHNTQWRTIYGLSKGRKWTDEEIEIKHNTCGHTVTVVALGITGQIRGLNIDDYRPDLIVIDDACDEENTASPEQRAKTDALIFGSLDKSLAPATECPDAKMVILQTPINREDVISRCLLSPMWATKCFGCFDENGLSRWEERFPTATLLREKQEHADENHLLLWLREKECLITSEETSDFKEEWIQYWSESDIDDQLVTYISIDPTPPPSEKQVAEGMARKDEEVISVVGAKGGNYYLLEEAAAKDHTPEWTVTNFFRLVDKWKPIKVRVEGIAYQRTLKWILERAMHERKRFVQIDAVADQRKKRHRILQALSGIASQKRFFIHRSMVEFKSQFVSYPQVSHDDRLDAAAMGISAAMEFPIENELVAQPKMEPLENWRYAP